MKCYGSLPYSQLSFNNSLKFIMHEFVLIFSQAVTSLTYIPLSLTLLPGSLDESWEALATQPFCPRESEASETQTVVTLLDTHASWPPPSRTAQQEQHPESPVHEEPLGMEGREMQTVEKEMGTPRETAERVIPEGGPPQEETKKLPSEGEREDVTGEEELIGGIQGREKNQVLARDTQSQESDKKVKSASTGRGMEIVKVEIETPKETQEKEREKQKNRNE